VLKNASFRLLTDEVTKATKFRSNSAVWGTAPLWYLSTPCNTAGSFLSLCRKFALCDFCPLSVLSVRLV
jgi:hypothetical protein